MPERPKHIGVDSFFAERSALLDAYAKAKKQTADDVVKTEHGNVAEALARKWLQSFLPKRFGVCKGYIITSNLNFAGPLEEWDILVYDAIESPILFTRGSDADSEPRRAIPVEYVRAVIETKATLTPAMARKCASKLLKLHQYISLSARLDLIFSEFLWAAWLPGSLMVAITGRSDLACPSFRGDCSLRMGREAMSTWD